MSAAVFFAIIALLGIAIAGIYLGFHLRFERWKTEYTKAVRRDAVLRSQAATVGKVSEQLVPYFPQFQWNPKDARFLGSPLDLIIFDGLSEGCVERIVFVEVKTGSSSLSSRERLVREAVMQRRVEWREMQLPDLRRPSGMLSSRSRQDWQTTL